MRSLKPWTLTFKAEIKLQLGKKIQAVKSNYEGEYYGRYDGSREQCPGPYATFLKQYAWDCPTIHNIE